MADQPFEEQSHSLISLCFCNKLLGIACYEEITNTLFADSFNVPIEDLEEIINNLKASLAPTMFLLHPKIVSNKSLLELILSSVDGSPDFYRFKVLKSSIWNSKSGLQLVHSNLNVRSNKQAHIQGSSYQQVASILDLDSEQTLQALSALLTYMQDTIFKLDEGKICVSSVKQLPMESYLRIDMGTYRALQIFSEEIHPNVLKGKGRSKEGFSLFGLFDRTHSLPGRQKLKDWMSRPYYDRRKILHRQSGVALVARPANREYVRSVCTLLRHFQDLPRLILRVKKVEATYIEWCKIHSSLVAALKVVDLSFAFIGGSNCVDTTAAAVADSAYISELFNGLDVQIIRQLAQLLQNAVDFPESEVEGSLVFQEGYDEVLDRMRHVYDHLEGHLVEAAHLVLEIVPLLQNVSVEYVPQVGYLVAVEENNVHLLQHTLPPRTQQQQQQSLSQSQITSSSYRVENTIDDSGGMGDDNTAFTDWEDINTAAASTATAVHSNNNDTDVRCSGNDLSLFSFVYAQGGIHYFKHRIVEDMDASIGDIKSDIADRQRYLLLQIEDAVLDSEEQLQQLSLIVATLDALISLGTLAVEQNLTRPEILDEQSNVNNSSSNSNNSEFGGIFIKNGRHLLQELTVDNFVANDTYISNDKNVALITGPNTSGKSVYLKQIGLIVYLAHIGSFVPCDRAIIGLTDRILTRISSVETVTAPQSAFALDLQQVSKMLSSHTTRSLCLLDEFGKGTTPLDGIALLAATVKHFVQKGGAAVFVLHFTEILHDDILPPDIMKSVCSFRMETIATKSTSSSGLYDTIEDEDTDATTTTATVPTNINYHTTSTSDWDEECTPLFKLKRGVASSSEGIPCARSAGIPDALLQRAMQVKYHISHHQTLPQQQYQQHQQQQVGNNNKRSFFGMTALNSANNKHILLLSTFLQTRNWISSGDSEEQDHYLAEFKECLLL